MLKYLRMQVIPIFHKICYIKHVIDKKGWVFHSLKNDSGHSAPLFWAELYNSKLYWRQQGKRQSLSNSPPNPFYGNSVLKYSIKKVLKI